MLDFSYIHPMIVHFPIALLIVGFLIDLLSLFIKKEYLSTTGFYLLILGTLGVVAAFITGNIAGDGIVETGNLKQALETHEGAAEITLWVMVAAAVVRIALVLMKRYYGTFKYVAFAILLVGVFLVARTASFGGELVYKHAAGVRLELGMDNNNTETPQQKEDRD